MNTPPQPAPTPETDAFMARDLYPMDGWLDFANFARTLERSRDELAAKLVEKERELAKIEGWRDADALERQSHPAYGEKEPLHGKDAYQLSSAAPAAGVIEVCDEAIRRFEALSQPSWQHHEAVTDCVRTLRVIKNTWIANAPTPQPNAVPHEQYNELLYAVGKKYPGESRHETALRYIRRAEQPDPENAKTTAASPAPEPRG